MIPTIRGPSRARGRDGLRSSVERPGRPRHGTPLVIAAVVFGLCAPAAFGQATKAAGEPDPKARENGAYPQLSFPWRADKQGDIMLLQKLSYREEGKHRRRESVMRVIPAAKVEPIPRDKVAPSRLAKVRRKEAEWHVQKDGSVVLLQRRIGEAKGGKPAVESALVARIPARAAGSFADVHVKPPTAGNGGARGSYWSRGKDGGFVYYQNGRPLPLASVPASRLSSAAYLDEDYDGTLEDSEVYNDEEVGYLDDLDEADEADFDDDEDDFADQDGDGLDEDEDVDDEDMASADDDDDEDEDGDLDDDGDD